MTTPKPEQIAKLPKWAQEYVADVQRRVHVAERALANYLDHQTPSEFFHDDTLCIGESTPKVLRNYVQTNQISVMRDGIRADILLRHDEPGIEISWGDESRTCSAVPMVPYSFQKIRLVQKDKLR